MERSRPRLGETVIVFSVAGAMFAIAASAVDEIRDLTALQKFTLGTAQQRLARVKQTLAVVDVSHVVVAVEVELSRADHRRPRRVRIARLP